MFVLILNVVDLIVTAIHDHEALWEEVQNLYQVIFLLQVLKLRKEFTDFKASVLQKFYLC